MNIEIRDDTFKKIVDPNVSIQQLATGFEFTEGPVWNPIENALIFSDMPGNIMPVSYTHLTLPTNREV